MLILVTRSIKLSNTQYSLLLNADGQYLTLGSEWIGSLVEYDQPSICFSKLFAEDPFYTNVNRINNDECEYFCNGIINNDQLFINNYVFDFIYEIKFHFGGYPFFMICLF